MTKPPDDIEEVDPALAWERTTLAWTRTAIGFAALGATILKFNPAAGIPILVFSAVIWQLGRLPLSSTESVASGRRVLLTTVAVTAVSLAALAITLLGRGSAGLRP